MREVRSSGGAGHSNGNASSAAATPGRRTLTEGLRGGAKGASTQPHAIAIGGPPVPTAYMPTNPVLNGSIEGVCTRMDNAPLAFALDGLKYHPAVTHASRNHVAEMADADHARKTILTDADDDRAYSFQTKDGRTTGEGWVRVRRTLVLMGPGKSTGIKTAGRSLSATSARGRRDAAGTADKTSSGANAGLKGGEAVEASASVQYGEEHAASTESERTSGSSITETQNVEGGEELIELPAQINYEIEHGWKAVTEPGKLPGIGRHTPAQTVIDLLAEDEASGKIEKTHTIGRCIVRLPASMFEEVPGA